MNQAAHAPQHFKPASCPLLAAVLPVRYAIGPVTSEPQLASIDASALGLQAVSGQFPELGPDHPPLTQWPLGYVPRLLRDGWLYVWQDSTHLLSEYRVDSTLLSQTPRGGPVLEKQAQVYLLLPAGAPAQLVWSPVRWSDSQFTAVKTQGNVRQRVMRNLTPGIAPESGLLSSTRKFLGDSTPENFRWSCLPEPQPWQLNDPILRRMQRCEQQHYAIVDDPWGVLIDLAGLVRARNLAFDKQSLAHRDRWMVASVLQELSEHDKQLKANLPSDTDYEALKRTWREQKQAADQLDFDRRRIVTLWADWFGTLGQQGPATLETACGHMDITQHEARDLLEASFAAACLGPSATAIGVQALYQAMDLENQNVQKPWLVWALLGLQQRLSGTEVKQLLHVPEGLEPLESAAKRIAQALALVAALNAGASKLSELPLAKPTEAFFAAMAPVVGGHMRSMPEQVNLAALRLLQAMLARSQQQVEVQSLSAKQSLAWLGEQLDGTQNKSKRRRLKKEIATLEEQDARNARVESKGAGDAATGKGQPSAIAKQVQGYPHLNLIPAQRPAAPAHPAPGYGSGAHAPTVKTPGPSAADLPPLPKSATKLDLPLNARDLLNDSPLKVLIALVSVWNLRSSFDALSENYTNKNNLTAMSAGLGVWAAFSTISQHLADVKWKAFIGKSGKFNFEAQKLLANALKIGASAVLIQAATAGLDTIIYGWDALDSYRIGDIDTATVNVGLGVASFGYIRVSLQISRMLRVSRATVIMGSVAALGRGISVLPAPLVAQATGLVITIFGGLLARMYTKDTPVETWVKQTCFGTRPANWSNSYEETMKAYYQAVAPVTMKLRRWIDINPVSGEWVNEVRLVLLIEGQTSYQQGMVSFSGVEEWTQEQPLMDFSPPRKISYPLEWGEEDPNPLKQEFGSRIRQEPGVLCLSAAYHQNGAMKLTGIRGNLIYQPIEGIYLPLIDVNLS
ncbi:uncharacterized protein POS17_5763 [Pseudomonas sp. Os17]|uniref:toxin VasX n=1 Tax=Pseudomonas sp. Os17 TaxID=1500686 RepID=UPI0005FC9F55|nr:toxin VasX [Pseudomonas sp. Os17]BAQ77457.1 uncharacterized protein POS17_5763 [Pseudomonas sp. Os17]